MRRAIIAEALSAKGLHFYCGGESVLVDVPLEIAANIKTGNAVIRLSTDSSEATICGAAETWTVSKLSEGALLLSADSVQILVCGEVSGETAERVLCCFGSRAHCAFLTAEAFLCGGVSGVLASCGIKKVFVNGMPEAPDAEFSARLNKRIRKPAKSGITVRIINSYPTGFLL